MSQVLPDLVIPFVRVGTELDRTIRFDVSSLIYNEDRKRVRQSPPICVAERDTFVNCLGSLSEQELSEHFNAELARFYRGMQSEQTG